MFGRRRPLLRGAIVGGAAYQLGKNRARDQAQDERQSEQINELQSAQNSQPTSQQSAQADDNDKNLDKIKQLQQMHDSGALTDDEFAKAKEKIIGQL